MRTSLKTISFAVAVGFLLVASRCVAADRIPVERRLPPTVQTLIVVGDMPKFREQFHASVFGKLLAHPQMPKWPAENLQAMSKMFESSAGVSLKELLEIPRQEFVYAIVAVDNIPTPMLMVDLGKESRNADKLVKLFNAWVSIMVPGKELGTTREVLHGTPCQFYALPKEFTAQLSNDVVPKDAISPGYCTRDNYFVAAYSRKTLSAILERWDGRHERTLENSPSFKLARKNLCGTDLIEAELLSGIRYYSGAVDFSTYALWPEIQIFLGNFGLSSPAVSLLSISDTFVEAGEVPSLAMVLTFCREERDLLCRSVAIPARTFADRLDQQVSMQPIGTTESPPSWIRSNVNQYWEWRWKEHLTSKLNLSPAMLLEIETPLIGGLRAMDKLLVAQKTSVLQFSTGLARLMSITTLGADESKSQLVLSLELRDRDSEASLKKLLAEQPLHGEKVGLSPVWTIHSDRLPFAQQAGETRPKGDTEHGPVAYIAFAHQQLLVGMDVKALRMIAEPNLKIPALSDVDEFKTAMRGLPKESCVRRFNRITPLLLRGLLCNGEPQFEGAEGKKKAVAVSETFAKYLSPYGGYVERTKDGTWRSTVLMRDARK